MNKAFLSLLAALGVAAFLFMVKLMHDMSVQMAAMGTQITRMAGHTESLAADVHGMRASVEALADDVRGMRTSMDRVSAVVQSGSQQLQQMSPLEIMRGVVPGARAQ